MVGGLGVTGVVVVGAGGIGADGGVVGLALTATISRSESIWAWVEIEIACSSPISQP